MSSIVGSLASNLLQSVLGINQTQTSTNSSNLATVGTSTIAPPTTDSSQLSSFAQLASTLQQLQQSNPAEFKQVTQQIATNLQTAAQTASASGNTTQAADLTKLSTDFSTASSSGQLPNLQDLANAVSGGHHGHHHHFSGGAEASASSSTSSSTSTASNSQAVSQLLASLQSTSGQTGSTNAGAIISNTLTSAGISIV
jgi:hypothetical protein